MATEKHFEHNAKSGTLYRLDSDQYKELVRQLPKPIPSENTTDIQAGYLLGIQHVLDKLREGFVIESTDS